MPSIDITNEPLKITANGQVVAQLQYQGTPGHEVNLILPDGEITNIRNFQGGTVSDPNLDISAGGDGSPGHPRGHVGVQWDNGSDFIVADGRKRLNLRSHGADDRAKDYVETYVPFRAAAGIFLPDGSGGWSRVRL